MDKNKLLISSDFYSVQGEGKTTGYPSYFIRLGLCNLRCGCSAKFNNSLLKEKNLQDGETFVGDLQKEGKATWTCDSTSQWLWRGVEQNFDYLITHWKLQGLYDDICNGRIHLIWTGGEPTLPIHQESISNFIDYWAQQEPKLKFYSNINKYSRANGLILSLKDIPFHEIETNGTQYIESRLFNLMTQINCSPKLSDSGMSEKQRIVPKAINRVLEHPNYQFKFVISTEEDVKEMFRDYIQPYNIPLQNVCCMPGLDDVANFEERTRFVFEMAKKYKFIGLSRMHIAAWNKTLNV